MYAQSKAGVWIKCRPTSFSDAKGKYEDFHPGVDVACPVGTPLRAPADGKVVETITYRIYNPFIQRYVYGRYLQFRFGNAIFLADHLSRFVVSKGTKVTEGDIIARTGNSGLSSGPHVHMETRLLDEDKDPSLSWGSYRFNMELLEKGEELAELKFIQD